MGLLYGNTVAWGDIEGVSLQKMTEAGRPSLFSIHKSRDAAPDNDIST